MSYVYHAYTDGSYRESDGSFSYGAIILMPEWNIMLNGRIANRPEYASSRNVAGEIYGAVKVVQYAITHGLTELVIHHDYQGVGSWPSGQWKANIPLTKDYVNFMQRSSQKIKIQFEWVKGHSGDEFNEQADHLASLATLKPWQKKVAKNERV